MAATRVKKSGISQRDELWITGMEIGERVFRTLCWTVVGLFLIYAAKVVLVAWAGKSTTANISLQILTKLQIDRWIAYLFGVSGVSYGAYERSLRRRNIKRMSGLNTQLEQRLDPARTSSGLTPSGTTRKGD